MEKTRTSMLEQSVTELMDAEGLQRERAWHRMTEWCLAPNGGFVPGTEWRICTWHGMADLYLARNGGFVPGTERRNCTWHRMAELYLAPNLEMVPGTIL
ncbi:hypothetical protein RGU11_05130 [Rossellomorea marisflavi]|uniref:hypothetical protein n=1 Tax=Rossellomorea marisflavi TaxID=189381 RepID=UPI00285305AF|nr:hypothetical protein [Rossellomorea marisflavi]MDR4935768.1 hypothetical protein [Rossellomorea marisflavi]